MSLEIEKGFCHMSVPVLLQKPALMQTMGTIPGRPSQMPRRPLNFTLCIVHRWLGDRVGMFRITVAGLILMAVGYVLLGPAPPLQALLGPMHQAWLIWVSLSITGVGAGMAFVPLLPAMLTSLAAVSSCLLCSLIALPTPRE